MHHPKLFMVILGCTPPGRLIEQHDIFFGIGESLKDLVPQMIACWKEAEGKIHIDAWREVTMVDDYVVHVSERSKTSMTTVKQKLFFINLGGYKENEFEEYHYKIITAAGTKGEAIRTSKETAFYKHVGFKGAESHIDDKYGIDVDDLYEIEDILPTEIKDKFCIHLSPAKNTPPDVLHIGYVKLDKLLKGEV